MEDSERQEILQIIQTTLSELKKTVAELEVASEPVPPDNAIGRLSRMEALNSKSVSEQTLANAKLRTARLQQALKMADHEDFGLCLECGDDIPVARLKLLPESTLCMTCLK